MIKEAQDKGQEYLNSCFKTEVDLDISNNVMTFKLICLECVYRITQPTAQINSETINKIWQSLFSTVLAELNIGANDAPV